MHIRVQLPRPAIEFLLAVPVAPLLRPAVMFLLAVPAAPLLRLGYDVGTSGGCPSSTTGYDVSSGRPSGTTAEAGYDVSSGRPSAPLLRPAILLVRLVAVQAVQLLRLAVTWVSVANKVSHKSQNKLFGECCDLPTWLGQLQKSLLIYLKPNRSLWESVR